MIEKIIEDTGGEFGSPAEKWLSEGDNLAKIEAALVWAEKNPPQDNLEDFVANMDK